jgi:aminomuconate-semialdehyde/2-hydroxymuconate-6-semialdehyde dehydrogenase
VDVNQAVLAAKAALNGEWAGFNVEQRVDMLYAVANEITRRFDDFVEAQMGRYSPS